MIRGCILIVMTLGILTSCRLVSSVFKDDVVARVGKHVLYKADIEALNLTGFSPQDSAEMVRRYIMTWAKDRLLMDIAENRLSKADRDVSAQLEEYRRQLLVYRYEQQYVAQRLDTLISEEEYRMSYDTNPASYTTDVPLVKGIFIKISDSSPYLNTIKTLYRSRSVADLDRLRDLSHSSADSFREMEDWVPLDVLLEETGLEVSVVAQRLGRRRYVEHSYLGYTYLLSVREFVDVGEVAPYEYCKDRIRDHILNRRKQDLMTGLEQNLLNDAILSGTFIIYD